MRAFNICIAASRTAWHCYSELKLTGILKLELDSKLLLLIIALKQLEICLHSKSVMISCCCLYFGYKCSGFSCEGWIMQTSETLRERVVSRIKYVAEEIQKNTHSSCSWGFNQLLGPETSTSKEPNQSCTLVSPDPGLGRWNMWLHDKKRGL